MPRLRERDHEVGALADELAKLVPRRREEHESGQIAVKHFGVAGHINRLCHAWIKEGFISDNARTGLGEYHLSDDDVFVLRGKGTPDHPLIVVVDSFDELVREVASGDGSFERFQVPHAQRKLPDGQQLHKVAGPSLIWHDAVKDKRPEQSKPRANAFSQGSYGGHDHAPYCIDTAACRQWNRAALTSLYPVQGTRIIWQLIHKQPSIGTVAECPEPHESPLDDQGALRPGATPATEVAWLLEVEVDTNTKAHTHQAQERATETLSCHIIFSRRARQAVELARARLDLEQETSLAKAQYIAAARGATRVRAFV
ncbi:hypothetical protein JCM8208_007527 [Rhodotorula glutinis]